MDSTLRSIKKIVPKNLLEKLRPAYHYGNALVGAAMYKFPSKEIKIVAVTGTKGKTSTAEIVNAILEEDGYKTALAGTLRFKVGPDSRRNLFKMTMPGRFFLQKFIREAVDAKCDWVILEMTSEGAKQFRHKFIDLDALIFTNLSPEHIESHGSYEKYVAAKLRLGKALQDSKKKNKMMIVNADDKEGARFLKFNVPNKLTYSLLKNASPWKKTAKGLDITFDGTVIHSPLNGIFNIYNMLGALTFAKAIGVPTETSARALAKLSLIRGRMEKVTLDPLDPLFKRQIFTVIVDYAHTADSLEQAYKANEKSRKICILGNTGGGRDKWKRPEMGKIADKYCEEIILTNEDPYDENPMTIIEDIAKGIVNHQPKVIMDRRKAINAALTMAQPKDVIMITGKGTDPYIMGPNGRRMEWDDAAVVREELVKVLAGK